MLCVDVNVLVYAHRGELPRHEDFLAWLSDARSGRELLGMPGVVVSGFLRVVTNPRIFKDPSPVESAVAFLRGLIASPSVVALPESERQRETFMDLCHRAGASGVRVPDAYLASLAIEHGATLVTADRGFARYPGLRWRHPLVPPADG